MHNCILAQIVERGKQSYLTLSKFFAYFTISTGTCNLRKMSVHFLMYICVNTSGYFQRCRGGLGGKLKQSDGLVFFILVFFYWATFLTDFQSTADIVLVSSKVFEIPRD